MEIKNFSNTPDSEARIGVPLHFDNLRREDIQPLVDKMLKKIAGWRGKLLS